MKKFRWAVAQFFEKWWWNNYLKNKEPNKYLQWKQSYWVSFLEDIGFSRDKMSGKVADIGCGPAGVFILSSKTKAQWYAIDSLLKNYESLKVFKPENYQKVNFICSSFENYKNTEIFDTIFCLNAINHFVNINENLKKLYEVLDENGSLILSTDTHNYKFFKLLFSSLPFDILHPHQYTLKEYQKKIEDAGFVCKKIRKKNRGFIFSYYVFTLKKKNYSVISEVT